MRFHLANEMTADFGDVAFAALVAGDCGAVTEGKLLSGLRREAETQAAAAISEAGGIDRIDFIQEWRDLYQQMGASPSKRSSVENLYQVIADSGSLPAILPLVDLYNSVSCRFGLAMAAYDADHIEGGVITLRRAKKGEPFQPLGLKQIEKTKNGEVVYSDNAKVICRYWNHKDSDLTKLRPGSDRIVFMMDKPPSVPATKLSEALRLLSDRLAEFGTRVLGHTIAGQASPDQEIPA